MSKDQIIKPAVTTAVAAAAASTTRAMQSRISQPRHAGSLTERSLRALDDARSSRNSGPYKDDTEFRLAVNDLPLMSWLRDRDDIRAYWMSYGGED